MSTLIIKLKKQRDSNRAVVFAEIPDKHLLKQLLAEPGVGPVLLFMILYHVQKITLHTGRFCSKTPGHGNPGKNLKRRKK